MSADTLVGWPRERKCPNCEARAVLLTCSVRKATYECRGTPENRHGLYGPDRCGRTFVESARDPADGEERFT